ncbi:HK97 family phage prohead protease [uncultured Algimonas sp.]|uniref:HK97 family phage prohead protease n=1 Tax=uncultured Algimonas sp. TaxID=1547920 RepID=UPI00261E7110|nr:HK97 family phage prohead protease [uncultured Algimonas sp.]
MRISGYASRFDERDAGGDTVRRGAFAASLLSRSGALPMLSDHQRRVGTWTRVVEDETGLRVEGEVEDAALARLIRSGKVGGLSIGYRTRRSRDGRARARPRASCSTWISPRSRSWPSRCWARPGSTRWSRLALGVMTSPLPSLADARRIARGHHKTCPRLKARATHHTHTQHKGYPRDTYRNQNGDPDLLGGLRRHVRRLPARQ